MSDITKHLGQKSAYVKEYDPTLLVRELRQDNRTYLGLDGDALPFEGVDAWNAYEVSAMNENGLPYSFVLKISYPCSNKFIVESKSLKLYLMSFAFTKLGENLEAVKAGLQAHVEADLCKLLECNVSVGIWTQLELITAEHDTVRAAYNFDLFETLEAQPDADTWVFETFKENAGLLVAEPSSPQRFHDFHSSCLVSNCKVTNQPDSGDVFISIRGASVPTKESLLRYIVSFRDENHFHEEICEAIAKRLLDIFKPEELIVACLYSRRGGIDINPIRYYGTSVDTNLNIADFPHIKLPRQ